MNEASPRKRTSLWLWLPLALFAGFFALVMTGLLSPADREVASTMIGKPLPAFDLRAAVPERPGLSRANLADGKPRLLNIFASWCVPCVAEAPQLEALAAQGVEIDGIAIRDRSEDVSRFLAANGNPYARIGADDLSVVQLGIGSSGVPETFVIDGKGIIRHQHIGDIRIEDMPGLLEKLREAGR
jgi:cytochrome c biogenesis protein CcmG/thiol:disulfide interchange protein DsbE